MERTPIKDIGLWVGCRLAHKGRINSLENMSFHIYIIPQINMQEQRVLISMNWMCFETNICIMSFLGFQMKITCEIYVRNLDIAHLRDFYTSNTLNVNTSMCLLYNSWCNEDHRNVIPKHSNCCEMVTTNIKRGESMVQRLLSFYAFEADDRNFRRRIFF